MIARTSFAELEARERVRLLLDPQTFRELIDPFERVRSPYLAEQNVVAQSDDGVVVGRGTIDGASAVIVATDGRYLGGSIGEIGGAKIAGALECAADACARGTLTRAAIVFDSGGIRLQEANLGILAIAEICDAIVALRAYTPVVAIVAGRVGVYGGMGIAASLCSAAIVSEGARWGLNGPDVVEEEAGLAELDARDRPLVWRATGGRRRHAQGQATTLVPDDVVAIRIALRALTARGPHAHRIVPDVSIDPTLELPAFDLALRERYP